MASSSQGHTRAVQGVDSANQTAAAGKGGGYGGGAVVPATLPVYPPASKL